MLQNNITQETINSICEKDVGFIKESPYITEQRKKALEYLGNKHCVRADSEYKGNWLKH